MAYSVSEREPSRVFSSTFNGVAVSAAQDVFEITASAERRLRIIEIRLGQYSDFGDAQAELLSILVVRGYTVSGSGGSANTPRNINSSSVKTPTATVETNNTTVANTGTPHVLIADSWNVAAGAWIAPRAGEHIYLAKSERLVVRITAPTDAVTLNGTLMFEEIDQ